jgi:O-antigen/teichoic acid export membrane protein
MQNDHKIFAVAFANNFVRVTSILTSVFAVFALSHVLNQNEFGAWAWLLSICTLVTAQDFGVISAMRIEISKVNGINNHSESNSEQNLLILAAVLGVALVLIVAALILSLLGLISLDLTAIRAPYGLFALVTIIALFSLFGTVAANTLLGLLKAEKVTLLDLFRNVFQLAAVIVIYLSRPAFEWAIVIYFVPYALYALVGMAMILKTLGQSGSDFFKQLYLQIKPSLWSLKLLIKKGSPLWMIQLSTIIFSGSDLVYVGIFANENVIGKTAILQRYTVIAIGFITASIAPFLGYYATKMHHASADDIAWIREKSNLKMRLVFVVGFIYTVFLVLYGHQLTLLWSNQEIDSPWLYLLVGLMFTVTGMNSLFQLFYQSSKVYAAVIFALLFCGLLKFVSISLLFSQLNILGIWISFLLGNLIFLLFNFSYVRRKILN